MTMTCPPSRKSSLESFRARNRSQIPETLGSDDDAEHDLTVLLAQLRDERSDEKLRLARLLGRLAVLLSVAFLVLWVFLLRLQF